MPERTSIHIDFSPNRYKKEKIPGRSSCKQMFMKSPRVYYFSCVGFAMLMTGLMAVSSFGYSWPVYGLGVGVFCFFLSIFFMDGERRCVSVYDKRVVTYGILGTDLRDIAIHWLFAAIFCFAILRMGGFSPERILIAACILLFSLVYAYRMWSKGYIVDFDESKVSKDFLLFRYPCGDIRDFGGVDKVFSRKDMSHYFYRLWEKGDRYGEGVPISGTIRNFDTAMEAVFRRHVLAKFPFATGEEERERQIPVDCLPPHGILKLKSGQTIRRANLNTVLVYTEFYHMTSPRTSAFFYDPFILESVSVVVVDKRGELVTLVKYPADDRKYVEEYLANLKATFGQGIRICCMDNRM